MLAQVLGLCGASTHRLLGARARGAESWGVPVHLHAQPCPAHMMVAATPPPCVSFAIRATRDPLLGMA